MKLQTKTISDSRIWDEFVKGESPWSLFQSFTWGQLQNKLGHGIENIGYYDSDILVAVAQTVLVKARRGTFLHVRHGPIIVKKYQQSFSYWFFILTHLKKIARERNASFVRISPLLELSLPLLALFNKLNLHFAPIHAMDAQLCWVLPLDRTEAELLQNMRKTTRYLIKQAEKIGVSVVLNNQINTFMKLYAATAQRHGFVAHGGVVEEFNIYSPKNEIVLLLAKFQDQYLAGAIIIFFGSYAIYHHGASINSKIPASYLLQWKAIQMAKKRGVLVYNFWGIAPQDNKRHPWRGLTLFKQGFGGSKIEFVHAHDMPVSPVYWVTFCIEWIRKMLRGY